jgi:hypothetical protein
MTPSDKRKAQILAGLLAIAGLTWFLNLRTRGNESSETKRRPGPTIRKQIKDPTIQIKLIQNASLEGGGHKNIFQYRQEPLPPPAATIRTKSVSTEGNTNLVVDQRPQPPARESSKTFKYEGFSMRGATADGRMLASLSEGGNSYAVALGECLLGQYCVRQLSENMIEIEDLQLKQRRTFPRTFQ